MKWLKMFRAKKPEDRSVISVLTELAQYIENKSVSTVMDDWDAGYDVAIDEVLALVNDTINQIASENDVDYSGGY